MKMTVARGILGSIVLLLGAGRAASAAQELVGTPTELSAVDDEFIGDRPMLDVCYNSIADEYFVVYRHESPSIGQTVFGQRVNAQSGEPISGPITISPATLNLAEAPTVCFSPSGGGRYMVAYLHLDPPTFQPTVMVRFLDADGNDLGTGESMADDPAMTTEYQGEARIACDGVNFLCVWARGSAQGDIFGRFYSPSGVATGAVFTISASAEDEARPSVAWLGGPSGSFLVLHAEDVDPMGSLYRYAIRARRVSPGAPPLLGPMQTLAQPDAWRSVDRPRVVANPATGEFLAVWQESDNTTWADWAGRNMLGVPLGFGRTWFARVNPEGSATMAPVLLTAEPAPLDFSPTLAWNASVGVAYVAWQHSAVGGSDPLRLEGAAMDAYGAVAASLTYRASGADCVGPVLAARGANAEMMVAWDAPDFTAAPAKNQVLGGVFRGMPAPPRPPGTAPGTAEGKRPGGCASDGAGGARGLLILAVPALVFLLAKPR